MGGRLGHFLDNPYERSVFSPKIVFHFLISEVIGVGSEWMGREYIDRDTYKYLYLSMYLLHVQVLSICIISLSTYEYMYENFITEK